MLLMKQELSNTLREISEWHFNLNCVLILHIHQSQNQLQLLLLSSQKEKNLRFLLNNYYITL